MESCSLDIACNGLAGLIWMAARPFLHWCFSLISNSAAGLIQKVQHDQATVELRVAGLAPSGHGPGVGMSGKHPHQQAM